MVTLGIIGVVSAMTVPSLMQNYQRQSYVTQLHKVYNETAQALLMFQNDKNAVNLKEAGLNSTANLQKWVKDYFKVVTECDTTAPPCFAASTSYKSMSGATASGGDWSYKSYVLASGASVRPAYSEQGTKIFNIAVDINGQKGPNIAGRDLFWIYIYNNGAIDDYFDETSPAPLTEAQRTTSAAACVNGSSVTGCFGRILNDNWQMTY